MRAWTLSVAAAAAIPLELRSALHPEASDAYPAVVGKTLTTIHRKSLYYLNFLFVLFCLMFYFIIFLFESIQINLNRFKSIQCTSTQFKYNFQIRF